MLAQFPALGIEFERPETDDLPWDSAVSGALGARRAGCAVGGAFRGHPWLTILTQTRPRNVSPRETTPEGSIRSGVTHVSPAVHFAKSGNRRFWRNPPGARAALSGGRRELFHMKNTIRLTILAVAPVAV